MSGGQTGASVREVVHDLRAPLAMIRSECEALAAQVSAGQKAEIRRIQRAAEQMAERVDDVLRDAAGPPRAPEVVDVALLLAEVADRFRRLSRDGGVAIRFAGAPGARTIGDRAELDSALQNLIENAVRHAPAGTVVEASVRRRRGMVVVSIADSGPGVRDDERESAFLPGRSGRPGGSGLGLAIVRAVAAKHGGRARLEAPPHGGTTAILELPSFAPSAPPRGRRRRAGDAPRGRAPGTPA